ncbi:fimbria/pilus outer membrane usher protein [Zavarzinia sp. CC-PAN008]|uniref:fimbria/pilus outer membrane usher protein n=1 Tax=Zavarzinia sp. CC-PAN008 TaxID=3243332 RepID=UPI003F749B4F
MRRHVRRTTAAICALLVATSPVAAEAVRTRAAIHGERARMVFEFPRGVGATADIDGGRLRVAFDRAMDGDVLEIVRRLPGFVSNVRFTGDRRQFEFDLDRALAVNAVWLDSRFVLDLTPRDAAPGRTVPVTAAISPPPPRLPAPLKAAEVPGDLAAKTLAQRRAFALTVPIRIGGLYLGDGSVRIQGGDEVLLPRDRIVELLTPIVIPGVIDGLNAIAVDDGFAPIEAFRAAGLAVEFDQGLVELRIALEATQRTVTVLGQRNRVGPDEATFGPSTYSGYINLRSATTFTQKSEVTPPGRGRTTVGIDGAFRIGEVVIEHESRFNDESDPRVERGRTRVLYDDVENVIRYSAGDLMYGTTDFQGFLPAGGIAIERRYGDLQPYANIRPTGRFQFVLDQPSQVTVFLNGQIYQTLSLAAGPYDLRDFQLGEGLNDIVLQIENDLGQIQTIEYSAFFDNTLLNEGLSEFSYAVGATSDVRSGQIRYDPEAVGSFFHRYGLTNEITLGANGQATGDAWLGGASVIWASPFGTIDLQAAASDAVDSELDYALTANYRMRFRVDPTDIRQLDLSFNYLGYEFGSPAAEGSRNSVQYEAAARYSQPLPFGLRGSIGGRYGWGQQGEDDRWSVNAFVSRSIFDRVNVALSLERFENQDEPAESRALLTFNVRLDAPGQSVRGRHDTLSRTSRLDYTYTTADRVGSFSGTVGVQRTPNDYSAVGSLDYTGDRVTVGLDHDVVLDRPLNGLTSEVTRLRAGTALAFADGTVGWGRPIGNSFALVRPHESIPDSQVLVDNSIYGPRARTGILGPAIVPDLGSYVVTPLPMEVTDLPPGYDLGPAQRPLVQTAYRSGTDIRVGSARNISALGTLVDPAGQPIALAAGRMVPEVEGEGIAVDIFTNRSGRFSAQPLAPGRYRLTIAVEDRSYTTEVDVPDGITGLYRAGTVTVQPAAGSP